ncbi:Undecaprenyl-phosphate 4-deoxy-4-formamido-L-arabinose transferase [Commensalibacter sp. Nvir]|uniref:glycosyltransferase n=1 Tax=Commensalibacter sp. Nvir TaxID=3069817 RepID=UPI002D29AD05|nr:Undecaprenyl-phosphate 4-deoxy-4-formamido-L-arabinose transferase [Commensalibacter sp. Nvir]
MCNAETVEHGPELSVIVPCYNEHGNIKLLYHALLKALIGIDWEVIYVDDNSPDDTMHHVWELSQKDRRVRGLMRFDRRGLSSAVIEGVLSSSAPYIAVIDGDLQHDETKLSEMLDSVKQRHCDIVVGSRHIEGGQATGLANRWRHFLSNKGIWLAQRVMPKPIKDPMSGFFLFKREIFIQQLPKLSGKGFKILLDLLMACPAETKIKEIPFQFRSRNFGKSKLDLQVMIQFIGMLLQKLTKNQFPLAFLSSLGMVICGVLINFLCFKLGLRVKFTPMVSQFIGALGTSYLGTIIYTHKCGLHQKKFKKLSFYALCLVGVYFNTKLTLYLFQSGLSFNQGSLIGAGLGMIWFEWLIAYFGSIR